MNAHLLSLTARTERSTRHRANDRRSGGLAFDQYGIRALAFALALVGIIL
jgi:hypothetical protein